MISLLMPEGDVVRSPIIVCSSVGEFDSRFYEETFDVEFEKIS
jgi:hypothetical protein